MDLLSQLNPDQREAVVYGDGPLLVLAGAGSGKTKVLTSRVAYLLQEMRVSPRQILAITFTNKAAQEMKGRVAELAPEAARDLWICTFHAACLRILRRQVEFYGRDRNFVIYDTDDQLTLVKECMKDLALDDKKFPPRAVAAVISQAKNQLYSPVDFEQRAYDILSRNAASVYHRYQEKIRQNNAVDFDDLIFLTVRLFRDYPQVLSYYQERFRHILVDEYQDTNHAQYVLVNLLAKTSRNLFVVGDPDQGIYSWRGADIKNIMSFERDYPEAKVIKLEQNYRSTSAILDAANHLIRNNSNRKEKRLWTAAGPGAPLVNYFGEHEHAEADFVVSRIIRLKELENRKYGDFAVFYRTHAQSRVFEDILVRAGIPYIIIGGQKFYERKEIKDILAYLRLILNQFDAISLARVVNVPRRGIGQASLSKIIAFAGEKGISPVEAMAGAAGVAGLTVKARAAGAALGEFIQRLAEESINLTVTELARTVMEETGYRQELVAEDTVESRTRLEYLDEFLSATGEFDRLAEEKDLRSFLENIALVTDMDNLDEEIDRVSLMTLHSAKGLEFPVVFVTGLEEGVFPHSRSLLDPGEMEEERRLCYVGLTRARERLYLTHCWKRTLYGAERYNKPSRFLEEIPPHLMEGDDALSGPGKSKSSRPAPVRDFRERSPQALEAFVLGDKVKHSKWGVGVIVGIQGEGVNAEFKVAFPDQGIKLLLAKYAPLERAN
ncbi:ATP-dependent DNA helicase PcrA [Pelotomaculum schinkii]|uniref:ATP-dependent DNA helicase n=1 Tax=Pelotomaculum schinkii TaxID=78350 RepID=A0A4Y7R7H0_9FIRM|nr:MULTISPECIES: DNA helicase PcrA [Pelotomaculum]TEB04659.1 ATP-dependent DNA helicase PcrA [Pelotomaculum schinkii]TEB16128.1 ATP-dependent DNA helicase PcrA [Pelotomaculum sp. FP]